MGLKVKIVVFLFICFIFLSYNFCFAEVLEKLNKFLPPDTELLSKKEDTSQPFIKSIQYKFGSNTSKDRIADFYRTLFTNEGFTELIGYSPREKASKGGSQKLIYFFAKKPNLLATLNILIQPEYGMTIYYITLNEIDTKAIKEFREE